MAMSSSGDNEPLDQVSSPASPPAGNAPAPPPVEGKKISPKRKARKKSSAAKKTSPPEEKADSRPVAPKARVRIALASASAAKAGKAMLSAPAVKPKRPVPAVGASATLSKRILFITSECTPLAQTGGLGDAVAGLSKALRKIGHDTRIVMPLYQGVDRARHGIVFSRSCCVHFGRGEEVWVGIFEGKLDGEVPVWFIDYARYFDRPYIYDDQEDAHRFGVLSKAALQVCKDTAWIPHVAHLHDWMTAMSAVFLKTWDRVLSPLSHTASVLTIHNIGHQGKFSPAALSFYGLGGDYMSPDRFEDFGMINLLKAGIQYADAVTTVSPTYANEIRGPIGGMGLAPYLKNRGEHVFGIVNGVDTTVWNPATDNHLPARYSRENLAGKAVCKRALQERFGLTVDPKIPLFGIVSRFVPQKGYDLIRGALPQALRDMIMQVVVLGMGDPFTENFFRWLHGAFPKSANSHIGFVPELAHLIEAGSDFFLMPSLYEPCGLNQMYSSLYGSLPIVRATGGLDDTVENYNEATGGGTGFKFWDISGRALFYTIGWAVSTWFDRPHHYAAMQQRGMARDFTWESSAREYERVYEHALAHRTAI
ncbi:MAG TPA: glycogen/starch synthase [Candidatus Methylacidiphilales bacterium]|nr:glycogen/starch synthase [Candidatus Methylacidiphilales bacterium]